MIAIPLLKKSDKHLHWNAVLEKINEDIITVQITPAPDAVVAKWKLEVDTKIIEDGAYSYSWDTSKLLFFQLISTISYFKSDVPSTVIYILFNPWCRQDQVFLKSAEWRDEAVLNDVGLIWRGTHNRLRPVIWKYDQYEKNVLDCSLYLVHLIGKVRGNYRADPVKITR